jgi:catechol 2,3-dioxygenase-like lactoylglutathione lyase family enzyme
MIKVRRLGYAYFETADVEKQAAYYQHVVGLKVVHKDAGRACLASRVGQLAVVLEKASRERCTRLGFEIAEDNDFAGAARKLFDEGVACQSQTDPMPGVQRLLSFKDPKDTTIELFNRWSFLDVPKEETGLGAHKLGHIAFFCPNPQQMVEFYGKVMGFRLSDWIGDYFAFMRCGSDHHAVNFLRGPSTDMQHFAFELRDQSHLIQACDLLGRERIEILWGPVRHGPGHNIATYHRNPGDQIVELFCDMDRVADEELEYYEPRPWHRDRPQKPKVWSPSEQRDIWGLPSTPEFRRPAGTKAA